MTNPFQYTVGLKGVTTNEPPVWVNDLPGMSTELVEAVADIEDMSAQDATGAKTTWDRVQRLALEKLLSMVEGELSKSADFTYEITRTALAIGEGGEAIGTFDSYAGVQLVAPFSRYRETYLESLAITVDFAAPTHLVVYDRNNNSFLLNKAITVTEGYNLVPVEVAAPMRFGQNADLFVGLDPQELQLLSVAESQAWECSDTGYSLKPCQMFGGILTVPFPLVVMVNASVRNDIGAVIARYRDRLNWAYAHICGALLLAEKLASPRMNLFTNTNRAYTEDQEPKLMDEAKTLVRPVCRTMLKELAGTEVVTPATDRPFDPGYTQGSFV